MASALAALEKQAAESNRTVDELKFQLQQQDLYAEYIQYFVHAAQAAEGLERASSALETGVREAAAAEEAAVEASLAAVNASLFSSTGELDDSFGLHGSEALEGIQQAVEELRRGGAPAAAIEAAERFQQGLRSLVDDQTKVLRGKLKAMKIQKTMVTGAAAAVVPSRLLRA